MFDLHAMINRSLTTTVAARPLPAAPPNVEVVLPTPPATMANLAALITHPAAMRSATITARPASSMPAPLPNVHIALPREVPALPTQTQDKPSAA